MKYTLGNAAQGDAFYPRDKEIGKIYRLLDSGTNIYLEAPRRVGKTSILKYLENAPANGYYFLYIITESVYSKQEFFKTLVEELLQSNAIASFAKISQGLKSFIGDVLGIVKSIKGVEFREGEEPDYYDLLIKLFEKTENVRLVLMIDEFTQTIQNIFENEGKLAAQHFIQSNRELRHHPALHGKINFIYTGSVSLIPLVEKITSLNAINDLKSIEVPALTPEQAKDLILRLIADTGYVLSDKSIDYMLEKIKWLIPFHIQLLTQEVVDVIESTEAPIDNAGVDKAFTQIIHIRNKPQFEPYFDRLNKIFKGTEYEFAISLLKLVATKDDIDESQASDLSTRFDITDWRGVIYSLTADGYIFLSEKKYRFTSPILQSWCTKHICNGN